MTTSWYYFFLLMGDIFINKNIAVVCKDSCITVVFLSFHVLYFSFSIVTNQFNIDDQRKLYLCE